MTYLEAYRTCKSFKEFDDMMKTDVKIALFYGNKDRIKAIEKAIDAIIKEKGWESEIK